LRMAIRSGGRKPERAAPDAEEPAGLGKMVGVAGFEPTTP
jgi:hypothetical protein